jgi:hypothetical protein
VHRRSNSGDEERFRHLAIAAPPTWFRVEVRAREPTKT